MAIAGVLKAKSREIGRALWIDKIVRYLSKLMR